MSVEQIKLFFEKRDEHKFELVEYKASPGASGERISELKAILKDRTLTQDSSYTYIKLSEEVYAMIRCFYIEDGDKYGAHALILEEPSFYPFEIIDSPDFLDGEYTEEIKTLQEVRRGPYKQNPEIMNFIYSRGEEALEDIINLLIFSSRIQGSLSIIDNRRAFTDWIVGILSAFSCKIASRITFTTNEAIGKESCLLSFRSFSGGQKESLVFDFIGGVKSAPPLKYRYAQLVRTGYFKARSILTSLHRFFDQFTLKNLNDEVDKGCRAFLMLNYSSLKLPEEDVTEGLEFITKYSEDEVLISLLERYGVIFDDIVKNLNLRGSQLMLQIVEEILRLKDNRNVYERALRLFYETLDHMALNLKLESEVLFEYYRRAEESLGERTSFYKFNTLGRRIAYLKDSIGEEGRQDTYEFYTYIILNSFIKSGYTWNQAVHTEGFEFFVDIAVKNIITSKSSIEFLLHLLKDSQEFFINLAMIVFNRSQSEMYTETLGIELKILLGSQEEREAIRLRRYIFEKGGAKLLLQEFRISLEESISRRDYFNYYKENILSSIPGFNTKYYQDIVVEYLSVVDEASVLEESIKFLRESSHFDRDILKRIIEIFEKNISLSEAQGIKNDIGDIARIKRSMDIKTYPDITYLLDILFYMEDNSGLSVEEVIDDIDFNLRGIKEDFLLSYIALFLTRILFHVKSKEDHRKIVDFVFKEGAEDNIKYYFNRIISLFAQDSQRGYRPFVHYISFYFFYIEPFHRGKEDGIVEHIETKLKEIFEAQSRDFLEEVDRDIKEEFEGSGLSIPIKWSEMYRRALDAKTLRGRIKRILSRESRQ